LWTIWIYHIYHHIRESYSNIWEAVVILIVLVVGFTTTCTISVYHHYSCEFESHSMRGVLDTTLYLWYLIVYSNTGHNLFSLHLNICKDLWSCALHRIFTISIFPALFNRNLQTGFKTGLINFLNDNLLQIFLLFHVYITLYWVLKTTNPCKCSNAMKINCVLYLKVKYCLWPVCIRDSMSYCLWEAVVVMIVLQFD
jgi:hypothetical protein